MTPMAVDLVNDDDRGGAGARADNEGPGLLPASHPPAAQRALAEAAARRTERAAGNPAKELRGRGGLDPVRYGDWEVKGMASDF